MSTSATPSNVTRSCAARSRCGCPAAGRLLGSRHDAAAHDDRLRVERRMSREQNVVLAGASLVHAVESRRGADALAAVAADVAYTAGVAEANLQLAASRLREPEDSRRHIFVR